MLRALKYNRAADGAPCRGQCFFCAVDPAKPEEAKSHQAQKDAGEQALLDFIDDDDGGEFAVEATDDG